MSDLRQVRLDKLNKLKEAGYHPYPEKYVRSHLLNEAKTLPMGTSVKVAGRIMLLRVMGKLAFAQIQDWSGRMQIALQIDEIGEKSFKDFEKFFDLGDFIGVEGEIFTTHKGEISVLVKKWTFLGKALLPLPEKWHGLQDKEACHRERYLDLIMNEDSKKRFQFRSDVIKAIRMFYWQNDFNEVETPTLTHKATGANARPYSTHNHALDIDLYLRISMELPHKMLIAGGYDKLFEIGKAFRNEGIDPSHLPEHTHFEHYCAYWSYEDNMKYTEELFDYLFENLESLPKDRNVTILDRDSNPQIVSFKTPFKRASFVELLKKDCDLDILELKDVEHLQKILKEKHIHIEGMEQMGLTTLIDQVYKKVSRPKIIEPTYVYDYPKFMQPLARVSDKDPRIVDQFQLVVNGWELLKAYSELVDPIDQAERFAEQAKAKAGGDDEAMEGDDEFITAMEYGMPPISGWGMGIDRLVSLLSQQENLRDMVLFPLMRPEETQLSKKESEARYRSKKIAIICDKDAPKGIIANAESHIGLGIAHHNNQEKFVNKKSFADQSDFHHIANSIYPIANLEASQDEIKKLYKRAKEENLFVMAFSDIMLRSHTDEEMMKRYESQKTEDITYYAIGIFGATDTVNTLTKEYKLYGSEEK